MIIPTSTTEILAALRLSMALNGVLAAYIIPAGDEHYTEFVAACHERRAFVSGFTGSAGTAIVTPTEALLWTDGRYYFQAEQQLDENWTLMRDGMLDVPTQSEWLLSNLAFGDKVGVDPSLYTKGQWDALSAQLATGNIELVAIDVNLVDENWPTRPPCSSNDIFNLVMDFSGKSTADKVQEVREEMVQNNAAILLVTELDEVAWLLNLRGQDIPSSAIFFGYVILTSDTMDFFVNADQLVADVAATLLENVPEIQIKPYGDVYTEFPRIIGEKPTGSVWVNRNANYKHVRAVDPSRLLIKLTPISLRKAVKNEIEVAGYRQALIRDCAALCEFFAWLEGAMEAGEPTVTEISAADKLYSIRQSRSELFLDKSFTTISATGVNGAVIHYMPTEESNTGLSKNEVYLLDSGGLYFDGTTDITRTMHFGTPTAFEKEAYTRVLKGQIALVTQTFPEKTVGHRLDSFARMSLWSVGLEYNHGTGHGIGSFLNVHEGPFSVGSRYSDLDPGLQENMFTSNEPGYYDEENKFGIRLENIIRVEKVELPYNFQNRGFLGFEDLTFLPYQHKMIEWTILTEEEVEYLNNYQIKAREIVGKYIQDHPDIPQEAYDWLIKETPPIDLSDPEPGPQPTNRPNSAAIPFMTFWILILAQASILVVGKLL